MRKSAFLFLLVLFGCRFGFGDVKKFIRKSVKDDSVTVNWYYESYISNTRDFVEVVKGDDRQAVLNIGSMCVTDISLKKDTLFIKLYKPSQNVIYDKASLSFGYFIRLDSSATQQDFNKIYQPEFYKPEK